MTGGAGGPGAVGVAVVTPRLAAGLARQTRAPDAVCEGPEGLEQARVSGARWVWVLAHGGDPRPDALERLLEAQAPGEADPAAIVAGVVVGPSGGIEDRALPGWNIHHPGLVDLVGRCALPIRHTTLANCLVATDCLTRYGLPDRRRYGPYAAVEWSARVLRDHAGYFTATSVVQSDVLDGERDRWRSVPALARMLRSGAWTRGDQLANVQRLLRRHRAGDTP